MQLARRALPRMAPPLRATLVRRNTEAAPASKRRPLFVPRRKPRASPTIIRVETPRPDDEDEGKGRSTGQKFRRGVKEIAGAVAGGILPLMSSLLIYRNASRQRELDNQKFNLLMEEHVRSTERDKPEAKHRSRVDALLAFLESGAVVPAPEPVAPALTLSTSLVDAEAEAATAASAARADFVALPLLTRSSSASLEELFTEPEFSVVIGPPGCGKSTAAQAVLAGLGDRRPGVLLQPRPDATSLWMAVADALHMPFEPSVTAGDVLKAMGEALRLRKAQGGATPVLVVDDVQTLLAQHDIDAEVLLSRLMEFHQAGLVNVKLIAADSDPLPRLRKLSGFTWLRRRPFPMPPASDIEAYLTQHAHLSEAQASEVVAVTGPLLSDVGVVAATFARARSRVSDAVVREAIVTLVDQDRALLESALLSTLPDPHDQLQGLPPEAVQVCARTLLDAFSKRGPGEALNVLYAGAVGASPSADVAVYRVMSNFALVRRVLRVFVDNGVLTQVESNVYSLRKPRHRALFRGLPGVYIGLQDDEHLQHVFQRARKWALGDADLADVPAPPLPPQPSASPPHHPQQSPQPQAAAVAAHDMPRLAQ